MAGQSMRSLGMGIVCCLSLGAPSPAQAVFICEINGQTSYQQTPCPRVEPVVAAISAEVSADTALVATPTGAEQTAANSSAPPASAIAAQNTETAAEDIGPLTGTVLVQSDLLDAANLIPLEAIRTNDILAVAAALDAGADINGLYPTPSGTAGTALSVSLDLAARDVFELLLSRGANVSLAISERWTPLLQAANLGDVNLLEKLLRHGDWGAGLIAQAASAAAEKGHADAQDFLAAATGSPSVRR